MFVSLFVRWVKFCSGCFRQVFFSFERQKKSLVVLDRWLPYTATIMGICLGGLSIGRHKEVLV